MMPASIPSPFANIPEKHWRLACPGVVLVSAGTMLTYACQVGPIVPSRVHGAFARPRASSVVMGACVPAARTVSSAPCLIVSPCSGRRWARLYTLVSRRAPRQHLLDLLSSTGGGAQRSCGKSPSPSWRLSRRCCSTIRQLRRRIAKWTGRRSSWSRLGQRRSWLRSHRIV